MSSSIWIFLFLFFLSGDWLKRSHVSNTNRIHRPASSASERCSHRVAILSPLTRSASSLFCPVCFVCFCPFYPLQVWLALSPVQLSLVPPHLFCLIWSIFFCPFLYGLFCLLSSSLCCCSVCSVPFILFSSAWFVLFGAIQRLLSSSFQFSLSSFLSSPFLSVSVQFSPVCSVQYCSGWSLRLCQVLFGSFQFVSQHQNQTFFYKHQYFYLCDEMFPVTSELLLSWGGGVRWCDTRKDSTRPTNQPISTSIWTFSTCWS